MLNDTPPEACFKATFVCVFDEYPLKKYNMYQTISVMSNVMIYLQQ